jgi:hypothetical protein
LHLNAAAGEVRSVASGGTLNGYSVHLVWQTGMGVVLGFLLSETVPVPRVSRGETAPARKLSLINIILFGVMALALAWFVSRWLPTEYRDMQERRALAKHSAEKPSSENLPQIELAPAETMLILTPIDDYLPDQVSAGAGHFAPMSSPQPQIYSVRYGRSGAPKAGVGVGPHVDVHVQEWPEADWARWELAEQNFSPSLSHGIEESLRFGNRILINAALQGAHNVWGLPSSSYAWASKNQLVMIDSYSVTPDEFLKEYLEKYPSSL